jgi:DNA-binding PadR family transcriptional regulator
MTGRRPPTLKGDDRWYARGRRLGRGEIRTALLLVLSEEPAHGYQLIQKLTHRTGGAWRPSPGSVYPGLRHLEEQGLARSIEGRGRRVYELTDQGREEAHGALAEVGRPPWEGPEEHGPRLQLRDAFAQLALAAEQVAIAGTLDQVREAVDVVNSARRNLYGLLALGSIASPSGRMPPPVGHDRVVHDFTTVTRELASQDDLGMLREPYTSMFAL